MDESDVTEPILILPPAKNCIKHFLTASPSSVTQSYPLLVSDLASLTSGINSVLPKTCDITLPRHSLYSIH